MVKDYVDQQFEDDSTLHILNTWQEYVEKLPLGVDNFTLYIGEIPNSIFNFIELKRVLNPESNFYTYEIIFLYKEQELHTRNLELNKPRTNVIVDSVGNITVQGNFIDIVNNVSINIPMNRKGRINFITLDEEVEQRIVFNAVEHALKIITKGFFALYNLEVEDESI